MARILIIEDDNAFRAVLKLKLERRGYDVTEASDGEEGTRLYRETPSDLIITDIFMPEKEGLMTIRDLKREFSNVKIIAISAGGFDGTVDFLDVAKELGALKIFKKPISGDFDQIFDAVEELLTA